MFHAHEPCPGKCVEGFRLAKSVTCQILLIYCHNAQKMEFPFSCSATESCKQMYMDQLSTNCSFDSIGKEKGFEAVWQAHSHG